MADAVGEQPKSCMYCTAVFDATHPVVEDVIPLVSTASMKVAVDGRSLAESAGQRGVARYLRCLLASLGDRYADDSYLVLLPGAGGDPRDLEARNLVLRRTRIGGRPLFAAAVVTGRPRLDRLLGGCDVVWLPAVAPFAVSRDVPVVLTVHDLSFEHRPGNFSLYERAWHALARPRAQARRAARVIAVSETVRRQLVEEWRVPPERVVTVRSGPGRAPAEAPTPPDDNAQLAPPREPYVLAVGALEPRKHPELLIQAHARARAAGLRAELVFAGDGPLRDELGRSGATLLGYVPDEQLDHLYSKALAVVCVSDEEGFGFTPLEALTHGTPAIVSDLPVFAETLLDAALRVPPGDPEALARALLQVERDERLRSELADAGSAALAGLSWERAAEATHAVLKEAAEGGCG
jgi:glycosyltransferase involved in cell wall biosynthesis